MSFRSDLYIASNKVVKLPQLRSKTRPGSLPQAISQRTKNLDSLNSDLGWDLDSSDSDSGFGSDLQVVETSQCAG